MTVRIRPRDVDLSQIAGWQTFLGPWHLFDVSSHDLSFPSGHTTTAFALAYVLTRYYPRGRPIFLLMAVCAGVGRVVVQAHYPSDVVAGGVVGWGFAMIVSRYLLVEGAEPRTWFARFSRNREPVGSSPRQPAATK
jgi:undecaprenyl-diphosphatase